MSRQGIPMIKPTIKTAKKFGHASHIIMGVDDSDKKFLVFPESAKYVLETIIEDFKEAVNSMTNPLIRDFLTTREFKQVQDLYKKKIKSIHHAVHRGFLESSLKELNNMTVSNIGTILNDIENELPKQTKNKIAKEYYRINQTK